MKQLSRDKIQRMFDKGGTSESTSSSSGGSSVGGSLAITVPTGFEITPASLNGGGTFAITYAQGYSVPANISQQNWDAAYNDSHTHNNISLLDSITSTLVSQWNAAYGWGNHANAGYLKSVSGTFWGQSWSNGVSVTGDMSSVGHMSFGIHAETHFIPQSGYSDPVSGYTLKFKFGGTVGVSILYAGTGVYSLGYVSALSDIRKKDVKENFVISLDDLAKMNAIKFTWKDKKRCQDLQAGAIAQEWQTILPEVVHEQKNGELSLDYGNAALVSAISLAKEVQAMRKEMESMRKTIEILQSHNKVSLGQRIQNFIKKLFS